MPDDSPDNSHRTDARQCVFCRSTLRYGATRCGRPDPWWVGAMFPFGGFSRALFSTIFSIDFLEFPL